LEPLSLKINITGPNVSINYDPEAQELTVKVSDETSENSHTLELLFDPMTTRTLYEGIRLAAEQVGPLGDESGANVVVRDYLQ
jgi:hypothetical protein